MVVLETRPERQRKKKITCDIQKLVSQAYFFFFGGLSLHHL